MKNKTDAAVQIKKPATRPWDKKHDSNKEWQPDYLRLSKKHPGFHPRWVRKDKFDLWQIRGYAVARPEDWGVDPISVLDGKSVGTHIQRAELILMEIPEEKFLLHQKAMDERIKAGQRANRAEVKKELEEANRQLEEAGAAPAELIDETEGIR